MLKGYHEVAFFYLYKVPAEQKEAPAVLNRWGVKFLMAYQKTIRQLADGL